MLKNRNSLVLKHKFQQKLLNLWHIFDLYSLIVSISRLDSEMWPNFSYLSFRFKGVWNTGYPYSNRLSSSVISLLERNRLGAILL